ARQRRLRPVGPARGFALRADLAHDWQGIGLDARHAHFDYAHCVPSARGARPASWSYMVIEGTSGGGVGRLVRRCGLWAGWGGGALGRGWGGGFAVNLRGALAPLTRGVRSREVRQPGAPHRELPAPLADPPQYRGRRARWPRLRCVAARPTEVNPGGGAAE